MIDHTQLCAGRVLAQMSKPCLAAICMMSVGTLSAVESGRAFDTNPQAVEAVRKALELNGIRFTTNGAERI